MKLLEATAKLKSVKNLNDFQELFFDNNEPEFDICYKTGSGSFVTNVSAKTFDSNNSCTNSYMKFEDGFLPYPF